MAVRYSYLKQQFSDCDDLWEELKSFVETGDFTLGKPLLEFERKFAELIGTKFAIGVGSGTDAIKIGLKALGVKSGDEVITAANTFVATVGAIVELGAIPRFVDVRRDFCMDPSKIEEKITERTRAIVPVHFTGYMTDMEQVLRLASKYKLAVVEDACQSILASTHGKNAGCWGDAGAFSLHPLKNINVWADGGIIVTNSEEVNLEARLLRNHGLLDRDHVVRMGFNSRLDTFQAVIGNWLLPKAHEISDSRIANARYLDSMLSRIPQIKIPDRYSDMRIVYHLYSVFAENRDGLLEHCRKNGIEAKVHYPIPIYKQEGVKSFLAEHSETYEQADWLAENSISFPCDQHLSRQQLDEIVFAVESYYQLERVMQK